MRFVCSDAAKSGHPETDIGVPYVVLNPTWGFLKWRTEEKQEKHPQTLRSLELERSQHVCHQQATPTNQSDSSRTLPFRFSVFRVPLVFCVPCPVSDIPRSVHRAAYQSEWFLVSSIPCPHNHHSSTRAKPCRSFVICLNRSSYDSLGPLGICCGHSWATKTNSDFSRAPPRFFSPHQINTDLIEDGLQ